MPDEKKAKAIKPDDAALKNIVFIKGVKWHKVTEKEARQAQTAGNPVLLAGYIPFPTTIDGIYYPIEDGKIGLARYNKEI